MKEFETENDQQLTRRAVIISAALIPIAAIQAAPQTLAPHEVTSVFSTEQRRVLSAIVDRLIPKDDLGPGATECGVPEYIDGCLADFLAAEKPAFLQGLASVDSFASSSQGSAFAELSSDKQDAVLMAIDNNQVPGLKPFFTRVRRLTLEGMFGDPSYGGNRNFAGWDLIRYPGAKLAVSAQDQRMNVPPAPYRKELYRNDGVTHGH